MNIEIYGIESQILRLLSESEGNILDNTTLIETLAEAKVRVHAASSVQGQGEGASTYRRGSIVRPRRNYRIRELVSMRDGIQCSGAHLFVELKDDLIHPAGRRPRCLPSFG